MTNCTDKIDKVLIDGKDYLVENHDPGILNINKVAETFDGDLTYIGYWFVKDAPAYVFRDANPDVSKGHKEYFCVKHRYDYYTEKQGLVVMGYTKEQMEEMSTQGGTVCEHCGTVIWSLTRHDYHSCRCTDKDKRVCIDGGMDYTRKAFGKNNSCRGVTVNHLTRTIKGTKV